MLSCMNDPVAPLPEPVVPIGDRAAGRRPGWWIAPVYLVMAAVLVPWIVVLFQTLPERLVVANYRLPWIGFDVMLAVALLRTAWLAYRRSPFLVNVASVTAALLVVDAWFDITTAPSGRRLVEAIVAAVAVELPLAALSRCSPTGRNERSRGRAPCAGMPGNAGTTGTRRARAPPQRAASESPDPDGAGARGAGGGGDPKLSTWIRSRGCVPSACSTAAVITGGPAR